MDLWGVQYLKNYDFIQFYQQNVSTKNGSLSDIHKDCLTPFFPVKVFYRAHIVQTELEYNTNFVSSQIDLI